MSLEKLLRPIRSYVHRQRSLTLRQRQALEKSWPEYGIDDLDKPVNFSTLFPQGPVVLEIGFGMGQALIHMAKENPSWNFIGIEVHRPGVAAVLVEIDEQVLTNIRLYCHDAVQILNRGIPDQSLSAVHLFFPDPWPKQRHHKRRLVQPEFVELIAQKLITGGKFHLATDWENYAEHMLKVLSANILFKNEAEDGRFVPRPTARPLTKFEQRGQKLGHGIWDLVFIKHNK